MLRIGINVGDVIGEGADIYGEGVNLAARLEALAAPGGVAISSMVHDSVGNRIDETFTDWGDHQVRNIARPVHVWHWPAGTAPRQMSSVQPSAGSQKPSILILPLTSMSNDRDQDYFVDGLTEDFITELSRYKGIKVAARHTSFHYKGKSPQIADIRQQLAVGYVLEGSVRRIGNRVRVTAQLIDSATGSHVWAECYDRDLADIFAMQDELIAAISTTLEGRLTAAGAALAQRKLPLDWNAYD